MIDVYSITDAETLKPLLNHADWWIRSAAGHQLSELAYQDQESIEAIEKQLASEPSRDCRNGLREALRKIKGEPFDLWKKLSEWE